MRLLWEDRAWEDYLYWQMQDKKTLKRINALIKDIARNAFDGIGKPEPLRGTLRDDFTFLSKRTTGICAR